MFGAIGGGVVLIVTVAAVAVLGADGADPRPSEPPATGPVRATAPLAAGDSSANIPLNSRRAMVVTRWVARRTGVVARLYLHVKVEGSTSCPFGGRSGYAHGTAGIMRVTTHPVLRDGRPDLRRTLARDEFAPCRRQQGESVATKAGIRVRRGQELATVVRNVDRDPARNWFSQNFLYAARGLVGANARNERRAGAGDAEYGLDPRELVGYSPDGGRSWFLPGGPNRVKKYIPAYIQQYADGSTTGQPYYSATTIEGPVTMTFAKRRAPWTIRELGAYTSGSGASTVQLLVDGKVRASARLSGTGMLRAPIKPVTAPRGSLVQVQTTAGPGGLALRKVYADAAWASLMKLGRGAPFFLAQDPATAATVFPLPAR